MSTLLPPPTQPKPITEEWPPVAESELLVREARARQRRRRLCLLAAALGLAAAGAIAYGLSWGGASHSSGIERVPNGPVVNVRAFSHHGSLAFVSRGTLWLLDGNRGVLRSLARRGGGFTPAAPSFSPDGKWLAYLKTRNSSGYSRLWIARSNGSDAHSIRGLQVASVQGWNPRRDVLAVEAGPVRTKQPCPCYSPTTLRTVSPSGEARTLARAPSIDGSTWSPDGKRIAVAEINYPISKIVAYPSNGGTGKTWFSIASRQRLNGMNQVLFQLAGWWPHLGIGFWAFGDGAVRNLDAAPLDVVSAKNARPRLLGRTLSDGGTDAIAASQLGQLAVVTDHGGGRSAWQDKAVEVCGTTGCHGLPHRSGTVTVDPVWSGDGRTLAYTEAPNVDVGPWSQSRIAAWFAAHRVLLYSSATGRRRSLTAARGATSIKWSANDHSLLYVRGDALWLLPTLSSQPVRIAAPLYPPNHWPQYYAEIAWSKQFAWSSG